VKIESLLANVNVERTENTVKPLGLAATRQFATSSYIPGMPKRKRERVTEWEVIRLKATPAAFVGLVRAPDEATALKTAIKLFGIRPEDQSRLIVRPR
jgi:hypothetical protein